MPRKKTHEEFVEDIRRVYGNAYSVETEYRGNRIYVDLKCSKCGYVKKAMPNSVLTYNSRCLNCMGKILDTEKVKEMIKDKWGDEYSLVKPYTGDKDGIWIRHNSNMCGYNEFKTYVSNLIHKGHGCKACSDIINGKNKTKVSVEKFKEYANSVDGYTILGEPKRAKDKFLIKPESCGHEPYMVTRQDFERGSRCPKCVRSKGEERIERHLLEIGVLYHAQYTFDDLYYKKQLRFDFAIFDENKKLIMLIEFDGQQHYESVGFFGGEKTYEDTLARDELKNEYCSTNDIKLIRIAYWDYENIEDIIDFEIKQVKL